MPEREKFLGVMLKLQLRICYENLHNKVLLNNHKQQYEFYSTAPKYEIIS
jgi:hypothetical protein